MTGPDVRKVDVLADEFSPGDRVRIVALGIFVHSPSQGLVVGGTGTVVESLDDGFVSVRTDVDNEVDALSLTGDGWAFMASELASIGDTE